MYTCFWLDPHRYHYLAYLQGSRTPRGWRGARLELGTLGGERLLGDRTALYARARRCSVPLIESSHGFEDLRVMFLSLSASATTPGKHSSADYLCHSPVNGSRISMILGPAQRAALSRSGAPFWRRDKSSSSLRLASISAALSAAVSSPTGESTFRNSPGLQLLNALCRHCGAPFCGSLPSLRASRLSLRATTALRPRSPAKR
jgi:hypothetical protein